MDSKKWTYKQPIIELPKKIRGIFRKDAENLLWDLENRKYDWGYIEKEEAYDSKKWKRVIIQRNAEWYSDLYWNYRAIHNLKFDRQSGTNAIQRIADLKDKPLGKDIKEIKFGYPYIYDFRMRKFIFERLIEGQEIYGRENIYIFPANNEIREFFGLERIIFEEENEEIKENKEEEIKLEDIPF